MLESLFFWFPAPSTGFWKSSGKSFFGGPNNCLGPDGSLGATYSATGFFLESLKSAIVPSTAIFFLFLPHCMGLDLLFRRWMVFPDFSVGYETKVSKDVK